MRVHVKVNGFIVWQAFNNNVEHTVLVLLTVDLNGASAAKNGVLDKGSIYVIVRFPQIPIGVGCSPSTYWGRIKQRL